MIWSTRYRVLAVPDDDQETAYPISGYGTRAQARAERDRLALTDSKTRFLVFVDVRINEDSSFFLEVMNVSPN